MYPHILGDTMKVKTKDVEIDTDRVEILYNPDTEHIIQMDVRDGTVVIIKKS